MRKSVTLIELVIVIVLVGVLSVGFSRYFVDIINTWNFVSFRSEVVNVARSAFMQMTRRIRQIKKRTPSENTIETADIGTLKFVSLDTSDNNIRIRYRVSGNELYYDLDSDFDGNFESSHILLGGVYNFHFRYYKNDGTEMASYPLSYSDREDIYQIGIEFEIRERDQSYQFYTKVFPRNFKE